MQGYSVRHGLLGLAAAAALSLASCSSTDDATDGGAGGAAPSLGPQPLLEQQRAAGNLAVAASADLEQLIAQKNPDPVGTLETRLRAAAGVAQVERFDDDTLVVTLTNGASFSVFVNEKHRPEWQPAPGQAPAPLGQGEPGATGESAQAQTGEAGPIVCDPKNFPQSKKACIVPGFQSEFGQDLTALTASLTRAGFTPQTLPIKTPQDILTLHQTLSTCGVLYISSHGGRAKNLDGNFGNHITTEIELGLPDQDRFGESFTDMVAQLGGDLQKFVGVTAHGKKAYWTLSPQFFASVKYPNTLVYADACSSDKSIPVPVLAAGGQQLKDAFRSNGAGAFLGWNGVISTKISNPAADEIFDALAPKVVNIDSVAVAVAPPMPSAGQSYVPSATVSPAAAGVELHLTISGTDGFTRDETITTDASGKVTFASVPGGAGGVVDTITVSAGGAKNSATAKSVVDNDPTLQLAYILPWFEGGASISGLTLDAESNFNLVCNNQKLTQTQQVVKF